MGNTACCGKNAGNQYFGLAIGFTIVAAAYGAGSISGANLNPAVSLGIACASGKFTYAAIYTAFQLVGAGLAALVTDVVRPGDVWKGSAKKPVDATQELASEFLGTFFLVLTVGLNVIGQS